MKKIFTQQLILFIVFLFYSGLLKAQQLLDHDFNYSGNLTSNGWTAHMITVYIPGNNIKTEIRIFDAQGKLVRSVIMNESTLQLPITGFSKGVYSLEISNNQVNEFKRVVVD